jgi:thioredoxin-related protein
MKKNCLFFFVLGLIFSFNSVFAGNTSAPGKEWKVKYNDAVKEAKVVHKPILMVFAGSDWCKPCIMLRKEVWDTEAFRTYAKDHYVLLELDFPRFKKNQLPAEQVKQNEQLASQFNKEGTFPLVVLTDAEGHVLGKTGYKAGGPEKYIQHLESLMHH